MPQFVCPPGVSHRLDQALPRLVDGLSRTRARQLIAAGSVFLDGKRCRVASRLVQPGCVLRVEEAPALPARPLAVLYEDDACVAVDKPTGMPAAPTRQAAANTAIEQMKAALRGRGRDSGDLWLVHRLDRATSGVLLMARTPAAAQRFDEAFRRGAMRKEYVAWVAGVVERDEGSIDTPLRAVGARTVVDVRGQPSQTAWQVLERRADRTLLRLRPSTGRMHQLRVHLQSIGHPILGDRLYGGPPAPRLMLHAHRLRFAHPSSGAEVEITAPLPAEFGYEERSAI